MGQDLHNMGKEMEYYATKLYHVEKGVDVSNMFYLWQFFMRYKDSILPFGSIRPLRFHTGNCVSVLFMIPFMLPNVF